jgi:hypothetical protein
MGGGSATWPPVIGDPCRLDLHGREQTRPWPSECWPPAEHDDRRYELGYGRAPRDETMIIK